MSRGLSRASLPLTIASSGWDGAWKQGVTPWRAPIAAPALVDLIQRSAFPAPRGARVLVPGCGCGLDAMVLADAGYFVYAEDLSPTALEAAREKASAAKGNAAGLDGGLSFFECDYFSPTAPRGYAAIWDYTFLCALPPERSREWAQAAKRRLSKGGALVALLFPVEPSLGSTGPPFHADPDFVDDILREEGFVKETLAAVAADKSLPQRAGREWLGIWRLQ